MRNNIFISHFINPPIYSVAWFWYNYNMNKDKLQTTTIFPMAKRPLLFAHRGVSSLAPENTLAAFKKAKELGIPGVELDVHLTKDGELVVIHDESIKRTGRLFTKDMTEPQAAPDIEIENTNYADLLQYDFGVWFGMDFAGEKLPLLSEVLDILGSEMYADIEIKIDTLKVHAVAKKTAEVIHEALKKHPENPNRFLASSFNGLAIREFAKYSSIPTSLIYDNSPSSHFWVRGAKGLLVSKPHVLKPCWKDFSGKEKKEVWCWTVDDVEKAKELVSKGVKGICSNKPQDIIGNI